MGLKNICRALARDYGFPPMEEGDLYSFTVNDEFDISLELSPEGQRFAIYCDVAPIPQRHKQRVFRLALETNLFGTEIDQATIAIDPNTDQLVMFLWLDEFTITYSEFLAHLNVFIENLQSWRTRINEFPAHEENTEEEEFQVPGSMAGMFGTVPGIRV